MSVVLNGTNQRLRHTSFSTGSVPYTISLWIKETPQSGDWFSTPVSYLSGDTGYGAIVWGGYGGDIELQHFGSEKSDPESDNATATIYSPYAFSAWTHVTIVVGSESYRTIYVNGIEGAELVEGDRTRTIYNSMDVDGLSLGNYWTVNDFYFKGKVAEVAVYNRELTPNEISLLHLRVTPTSVNVSDLVAYYPLIANAQDQVGSQHLTAYNTPTYDAVDVPESFDPPLPSWELLAGKTYGPLDGGVAGVDFKWMGLNNVLSVKRLIYAANDTIWYESNGDKVELTAAAGDIDTSDQLMMFEGYQKAFIVNGAKLKVADFINTKLTHDPLTIAHANGDILTQAATSAQMIVDFTNADKTATYGSVISGTFNTTQVTGSGTGSAFTPSVVTAPTVPHWYDWTVYPGGTSGTMPEKAYLGCLYRGRPVLSGNTNYPFQWYMARTANPWDWAYTANDAQSPVAGGNSDAGEIGDIVKALIPYKDEYLIIGCANSMWVLRGDPAAGGSLEEIDLTVGIFGATSWCFDGQGNLYFMSHGGLQKIPANLGGVEPVSLSVLPNLSRDEQLDPSTHRVSMIYDSCRYGILVCITTLATGVNSNYFYDLRTQGLFPESYPTSCGVYSAMYYNANDDVLRGPLLGCTDGHLRTFDDSEKNDVGTIVDSTIVSSVVLPIIQNDDDDRELRLTSLTITTAGGASGGTEPDTDSVTVNVYSAESAEEVLEAITDGDTPRLTTIITGPGRPNRIRERIRGHSIAIELKNNTTDQTWAAERVAADIESVGKVRS